MENKPKKLFFIFEFLNKILFLKTIKKLIFKIVFKKFVFGEPFLKTLPDSIDAFKKKKSLKLIWNYPINQVIISP